MALRWSAVDACVVARLCRKRGVLATIVTLAEMVNETQGLPQEKYRLMGQFAL
jgi:hypothetical protein